MFEFIPKGGKIKISRILKIFYMLALIFIIYQFVKSSNKTESYFSHLDTLFNNVDLSKLPYSVDLPNTADLPKPSDLTNSSALRNPADLFDYSLNQSIIPRNITILMWTLYYSNKDMLDRIRDESPTPSWCTVTFDQQVLNYSDSLVFHSLDIDADDLPPQNICVPWVIFFIESPIHTRYNMMERVKSNFNRTMSYRLDSDYPSPYGFLVPKLPPFPENSILSSDFPSKKKLVAWMVSNCRPSSERQLIVEKLSKFIDIDIYGSCGTFACDKGQEEGCYEKLGQEYLFYLSFENSLCRDYISEKFSNALKYNLVPIVYGYGNYSAILPYPKSYINVHDYKNASDLAVYLEYLFLNRTAYSEYFEWHRYYDIEIRQGFNGFKKLCYALQRNETYQTKSYPDMVQWWAVEGRCKEGLDINWTD